MLDLSDPCVLLEGDSLERLRELPAESVDACVTDPPYGLEFMGKAWDSAAAFGPWCLAWAREVFRVLKPGAHLVAFGGTRTYHRLACGIEDAGFEIRDCVAWVYGQGFPKSLDVSKAIDSRRDWAALGELQRVIREARARLGITQSEAARRCGIIEPGESLGGGGYMWFETGRRIPTAAQFPAVKLALGLDDSCDGAFLAAEREVIGHHRVSAPGQNMRAGLGGQDEPLPPTEITANASAAARQWAGWGTALKPAHEPAVLARKPLGKLSVAANVLAHGTGAINVDACRVEVDKPRPWLEGTRGTGRVFGAGEHGSRAVEPTTVGRWPANLMHDGGPEALQPFGEAAAFFYCAKVSKAERGSSTHPTMKPVDLMRYLCRLVTPPGGLVLDPFTGSGSTGVAALLEGFRFVGVEREPAYCDIAAGRLEAAEVERAAALVSGSPDASAAAEVGP